VTDQIEPEIVVSASPEEVWDVVTSPGWLAEEMQLDLVPGGEARFRLGDTCKTGWIERADPPDGVAGTVGRLVFWWREHDDPATRAEIELTPTGPRATRVRVVEARPLEALDLVGIPLPGSASGTGGPDLVAAA
jgi:uncharacterized protein YndB with AHSA1/START domain